MRRTLRAAEFMGRSVAFWGILLQTSRAVSCVSGGLRNDCYANQDVGFREVAGLSFALIDDN